MNPQQFITKWKPVELSERSAYQQHFLDLCDLLGQPKPAAEDPTGESYTFEKGVDKTEGGKGWADVWKREHFGWEYKGKHKDLKAAYQQLLKYRESLENPPLLVVCDLDRFQVHTNFTGTAKKVYEFDLDGLADASNLQVLRRVFTDPNALRPGTSQVVVTEDVARRLGELATSLGQRGVPPQTAAHFLMKLMFCMFAEDVELLPRGLFTRTVANSKNDPARLTLLLRGLFLAMRTGAPFGADVIDRFNGGLFADDETVDLRPQEIEELSQAARCDWSSVEPTIFGTLFERSLDPAKRSQIGAHYTSRQDIETVLRPVLLSPLRREWDQVREQAEALWIKIQSEPGKDRKRRAESKHRKEFDKLLTGFLDRLAHVHVLDPACGSGNFLYVAINLLLDLEKEVLTYAGERGYVRYPLVKPTQLHGLEINEYARQLAQVVIWIGYLQWQHFNGYQRSRDPILDPIESIRHGDAILDLSDPANPREPEWPEAEFIVGNPPFLGDKKMRAELGDDYVDALRHLYEGRLPGQSDLCCYWFEKARAMIEAGKVKRVGMLATQGIRGGANRTCLERILETGSIFWAWSDLNWILDGATVHVSMVGFDDGTEKSRTLNDSFVAEIHANLTGGERPDVTAAQRLLVNGDQCYLGVMKSGDFDISEGQALEWLSLPNPHGRPNSDVLRPRLTARDILQRQEIRWIIDLGCDSSAEEMSLYEAPWDYLAKYVKPVRESNRVVQLASKWWLHARPRPGLRRVLAGLPRFIVTPEVSKHRIFVWLDDAYLADHQTRAFASADDYFFGVLSSRIHEVWSRAQGTQLREVESGFRYTPTSCFETFPFPEPNEAQQVAIAQAARELDAHRAEWLNPATWTREEVLTFPGSVGGPWSRYVSEPNAKGVGTVRYTRLVPCNEKAAKELAKRTLTNLYNQKPAWLQQAHQRLDEAVFAAYGWPVSLCDDELLGRLLALNLERVRQQGIPIGAPTGEAGGGDDARGE